MLTKWMWDTVGSRGDTGTLAFPHLKPHWQMEKFSLRLSPAQGRLCPPPCPPEAGQQAEEARHASPS